MGGSSSKKNYAYSLPIAQKINIYKMFNASVREEISPITREMLQIKWLSILSEEMFELLMRNLFKKSEKLEVEDLEFFYYKMVEATLAERAHLIIEVFGVEDTFPIKCLKTYVVDLINSYLMILQNNYPETFASWLSGEVIVKNDLNTVVGFFLRDLECKEIKIDVSDLEQWLARYVFVNDVFVSVIKVIFGQELEGLKPLLPKANIYTGVLSLPMVLLISHLTYGHMKKDWRLLYSSLTDAQSWNILCGKIIKQGPTIILIEDSAGSLFGGFASQSWKLCPNFYGDECCFLFQLRPQVEIYSPTGYNKNFQYLNNGATTLPNGLGMGGQLNYFTFFLNSDLGPGTVSKTSTTFRDYVPFTSSSEFVISKLEIWAIGDPEKMEDGNRQSGLVMDRDPAALAILEIAGKTNYSKNLPKPHEE